MESAGAISTGLSLPDFLGFASLERKGVTGAGTISSRYSRDVQGQISGWIPGTADGVAHTIYQGRAVVYGRRRVAYPVRGRSGEKVISTDDDGR